MDNAQLKTLVVIEVKLSDDLNHKVYITEDPQAVQPLNFYDITGQIGHQLINLRQEQKVTKII